MEEFEGNAANNIAHGENRIMPANVLNDVDI